MYMLTSFFSFLIHYCFHKGCFFVYYYIVTLFGSGILWCIYISAFRMHFGHVFGCTNFEIRVWFTIEIYIWIEVHLEIHFGCKIDYFSIPFLKCIWKCISNALFKQTT